MSRATWSRSTTRCANSKLTLTVRCLHIHSNPSRNPKPRPKPKPGPKQGTFATLKTSLPGRATWFGAAACKNVKDWRAWLGKTVGGNEPVPGLTALEPQLSSSGQTRVVSLALGPVRGEQDFRCAERATAARL